MPLYIAILLLYSGHIAQIGPTLNICAVLPQVYCLWLQAERADLLVKDEEGALIERKTAVLLESLYVRIAITSLSQQYTSL